MEEKKPQDCQMLVVAQMAGDAAVLAEDSLPLMGEIVVAGVDGRNKGARGDPSEVVHHKRENWPSPLNQFFAVCNEAFEGPGQSRYPKRL